MDLSGGNCDAQDGLDIDWVVTTQLTKEIATHSNL